MNATIARLISVAGFVKNPAHSAGQHILGADHEGTYQREIERADLEKFAVSVVEACAAVVDAQSAIYAAKRDAEPMDSEEWERRESQRDAMENVAATIRALKEK